MNALKYIWTRCWLLIALQIILFSCGEEAIEWELDTHVADLLVVEGVITNERTRHEVRITRPVADPADSPEPVSGAVVAIVDGTISQLLRETSPGIYHTNPNIRAVFNKLYTLYILYEGVEYTASSYLVPVRSLDELQYRRAPGQQNRYEMVLHETQDASMVEISLDWSHLSAFRELSAEET